MPKISENALEQSEDSMQQMMEQMLKNAAMHAVCPTFLCGVNRKINIGNFENIDVYSGLSVPLLPQYTNILPTNPEELQQAVATAAELAFGITSQETAQRYIAIKDMQKAGRQK